MQDLLDPTLRGKMAWNGFPTSSGVGGFIGTVLTEMGQEKGMAYLRELSKQNIANLRGSAREVLDQVIAGEYSMALQIFNHHAVISAKKGAPVDWIPMEPATVTLSIVSMLPNAPHPNAAKLFVDFIISREGQEVFRRADYLPAHPDVPASVPTLKPEDGKFRAHFFTPEQTEEHMPKWNDVSSMSSSAERDALPISGVGEGGAAAGAAAAAEGCDCQAHIFGDLARYPVQPNPPTCRRPPVRGSLPGRAHARLRTLRDRAFDALRSGSSRLAIDALEALPDRSHIRVIGRVDETTSDKEIERLHALGFRGTRFAFRDDLPAAELSTRSTRTVDRIRGLGWHLRLHFFRGTLLGACASGSHVRGHSALGRSSRLSRSRARRRRSDLPLDRRSPQARSTTGG